MALSDWLFGTTLRCRRCGSKNVQITSGGNGYSGFKGGLGMGLFGNAGMIMGVGGKKHPDVCHCAKCGFVWKQRF